MTSTPLDIGSERQLLFDDRYFEKARGIVRRMNPPSQDDSPVFTPGRPWESMGFAGYNTVRREEDGTFRLWYGAMMKIGLPQEGAIRLCYAESGDGAHWERPELGLIPFQGSTRNNIVAPQLERQSMQGATVYRDDRAPAPERYKLWSKLRPTDDELAAGALQGLFAMHSPDGIRWSVYPGQPNPPDQQCDTQNVFFWDDRVGAYVGYTRLRETQHADEAAAATRGRYRGVGRITSHDFRTWSATQRILEPDDTDREIPVPVRNTNPVLDYYTNCAMKYPWAQDAYLMFPSVFYHWEKQDGFPATMDVQLLTSRDGIAWDRAGDRDPFLRPGPDGSVSSGMIFANPWLVPDGDALWLYYTGMSRRHDQSPSAPAPSAIYRSRIRRDGFVSADAGYGGGEFTTPPLVHAAGTLEVNCDGSAGGWLSVEVQDASGRPLPGYTIADARPVTGNAIRKRVTWRAHTNAPEHPASPHRLRFVMRGMKLYAFGIGLGVCAP